MNAPTGGNPRGQRESRDHQPNQGTQAKQQDQAYFGELPGGVDEGRNEGLKLVIIALVLVGAIAIGLGLIFRSVDESANSSETASALAERNQMMREAMQMAREAQQMNRQRMMEMQQAMQEAGGYDEYGEYPGAEDYDSDP